MTQMKDKHKARVSVRFRQIQQKELQQKAEAPYSSFPALAIILLIFIDLNWQKQKRRVALLHEKVANQRKDFLHKESHKLAKSWDSVAIEDLNMKAMSQTLSLGKATMDNGNGMFRTFLGYKLADRGKSLVRIDRWFPSSKLYRSCGTIHAELKLQDRLWTCKGCGSTHERDENAAGNIREGLRILGLA